MAHHVLLGEPAYGHALHVPQHLHGLLQAAGLVAGQVVADAHTAAVAPAHIVLCEVHGHAVFAAVHLRLLHAAHALYIIAHVKAVGVRRAVAQLRKLIQRFREAQRAVCAQRRAEIIAELQSRIMDEYDFVKMISQEETQVTDEVFLADYNVYLERIFICDPERTLFTCIMRDVTKARQRRNKIQKTKIHAADLADDIIANQLRIVHEIASLLGETAAETKVAVHDLKEAIMLDEDGDDDA